MKITVYYEDNRDRTTIEVPDEDCEIWVETDYQQRLAASEDKSSVVRRTPQQIMDAECNKPTYNNQQTETRRHVSLEALDPRAIPSPDPKTSKRTCLLRTMTTLPGDRKPCPEQRELLSKVFWERYPAGGYRQSEGVREHALSKRMARIYASSKKSLP